MDIQRLIRWRPGRFGRMGLVVAAVLLVVTIGWVHFFSGRAVEFHAFYLLPVVVASWYGGRKIGLFMALLSAADWLWTEFLMLPSGSPLWAPLLNETLRLVILALAALAVTQLRQALDREIELARRDPLTRLLNRRAFEELCEVEIKGAMRYGHSLAAVVFDVDNFKTVNDTLGHQAGDELLQEVARVLNAHMRSSDIAGRMGGDEFALLLSHTDREGTEHFTAHLRDALLDAMKRHGWPVTFSIGVAVFRHPPPDVGEMLNLADALMYQAKEAGKDAIRLALQPNGAGLPES